jgi:hypothetical protein
MAVCSCNVTLSNTGVPGCQPLTSVAERLILVPMRDGSNIRNGIDLSAIPDNAGILALINASDSTQRYYPIPEMENVTNERAEPITEEAPSGTVAKIRNGVKTFSGEIWFQGATFAGFVEAFGCSTMGAYIIDADGKVIGDKSVSGYLYPLEIKMPTWDVRTIDTTDTTVAKVTVSFQWSDRISDQDVGFMNGSDFGSDVDWLSYNGLINLYGTQTALPSSDGTNTTFTMKIYNAFGSVANQQVESNLNTDPTTGDLVLQNVTSGSPIVPNSIVQSTSGEYTFEFPDQNTSDNVSVRIRSTTNGYDDTSLRAVTNTMP